MFIMKVGGQHAAVRIATAIGEFRLQNARGTGADKNTEARRAVMLAQPHHGLLKAILPQPELRQAIVAAFEIREIMAQRRKPGVGHLANIGIEVNRFERAMAQPRVAIA